MIGNKAAAMNNPVVIAMIHIFSHRYNWNLTSLNFQNMHWKMFGFNST